MRGSPGHMGGRAEIMNDLPLWEPSCLPARTGSTYTSG